MCVCVYKMVLKGGVAGENAILKVVSTVYFTIFKEKIIFIIHSVVCRVSTFHLLTQIPKNCVSSLRSVYDHL